jgi:TonB family protein
MTAVYSAFLGLFVLVFTSALPAQTSEQSRLEARDNLNRGIKAFRESKYDVAAESFKKAMQLDPDLTNAELYLATAYAQQYIPGSTTAQNTEAANNAIRTFESVLTKRPNDVNALSGLANLYQSLNDFLKAREYFVRAATLDPRNPRALYAIGAVDWYLVYDKKQPLQPAEQTPLIEEGLLYLDKALALDSQHVEAMTFMNLLLRVKAQIAMDPAEKASLIAQADQWFKKALETRRLKSPTPGTAEAIPPPPPPPPPPPQRIGPDIAPLSLLSKVDPVYPAPARAARVQDTVILEVVIDKEGKPTSIRIVKGHPLLNQAAIDAVQQWRYRPMLLNGQPIDVITTLIVDFALP